MRKHTAATLRRASDLADQLERAAMAHRADRMLNAVVSMSPNEMLSVAALIEDLTSLMMECKIAEQRNKCPIIHQD
jgi:predicted metal-dependent hydrolase